TAVRLIVRSTQLLGSHRRVRGGPMTARKRFKRRVRARAAKTGESYAVARRHLDHRPGQEPNVPEFRTVTNTLHGFAVDLPEGWREVLRTRSRLNGRSRPSRPAVTTVVPERQCSY